MSDIEKIQLFESKKVRTVWDDTEEKWYFSVVDVCGVLTEQPTPKRASTYWAVLKGRLKKEGAGEMLTTCKQLKLTAADGKPYPTDTADAQTMFRIIQSILTNELTKAWSGLSVREYKDLKGLKKENLRDNMTDIELVLNMLAEVSTKAISQAKQPTSFGQSKRIAREGGSIAGEARENIEKRIGTSVVTSLNAKDKPALETGTPEIDSQ